MLLPEDGHHKKWWTRFPQHDAWRALIASALGAVLVFGVITMLLAN